MKSVKIDPKRVKKNEFEHITWSSGYHLVGVDEVGRGCLAGPVVTAAVLLPPHTQYRKLKDSKELKQEDRELAYRWITRNAWAAWSLVDPHLIDTLNIYQATLYAMRRAVTQLLVQLHEAPTTLLVDGIPLSFDGPFSQVYNMAQGEQKSTSIAAASIYAKVQRDRVMRNMHRVFPAYHLHRHKGYSTQLHKQQLNTFGASFVHRKRFLTWLDAKATSDATHQDIEQAPELGDGVHEQE